MIRVLLAGIQIFIETFHVQILSINVSLLNQNRFRGTICGNLETRARRRNQVLVFLWTSKKRELVPSVRLVWIEGRK
jgi:hypothetical protein